MSHHETDDADAAYYEDLQEHLAEITDMVSRTAHEIGGLQELIVKTYGIEMWRVLKYPDQDHYGEYVLRNDPALHPRLGSMEFRFLVKMWGRLQELRKGLE